MIGSLRAWPKRDSQGLVVAKRAVLLSHGPHSHKLLTMGSSYLAVVMAHLQRADALAHSFHGEALFISVDQDGLYGGLQIFLTNDDWILRNLIGNVGRFVAQPRVLAWVDVRLKHLKSDPLSLFGFCTLCQAGAEHAPLTSAWHDVKKRDHVGKHEEAGATPRANWYAEGCPLRVRSVAGTWTQVLNIVHTVISACPVRLRGNQLAFPDPDRRPGQVRNGPFQNRSTRPVRNALPAATRLHALTDGVSGVTGQ